LYRSRDWHLALIAVCRHIGGQSQKGLNLKKAVRAEFIKNRALVDPKSVEEKKLKCEFIVLDRLFFCCGRAVC
jgi:hypothetical protein